MGPALCRVETLDEAAELVGQYGPDASILSGGQSLIPMMNAGLAAPDVLVDINGAARSADSHRDEAGLTIGPCVRHRAMEDGRLVHHSEVPVLAPAARLISHTAVRNRGTFAGSLAHADPAAEWPAVALAIDAVIHLRSTTGSRAVSAADFFLGPMTTQREPDELIEAVTIPLGPPHTGAAVCELAYRSGDYAVVGVVAQLTCGVDGAVVDARVALLGVAATPVRATVAERTVVDGGVDAFTEAAQGAVSVADPIDDATASAEYRRAMVPVFVERALRGALTDCQRRDRESGDGATRR